MPSPVRKHLPNLITVARLALAVVFFVILADYRLGEPSANRRLNIAVILFILAITTDAIDGYLARKWKVISVFGRVMDPLCDKILVIGALVFMAGPQFSYLAAVTGSAASKAVAATGGGDITRLRIATGVYSWMVVLVIFRELLITGLRSLAEQQGIDFSSNWFGKSKLILQSTVIPIVLVLVANVDLQNTNSPWPTVRDILVYALVIVTVGSGVPYVLKAVKHFRSMRDT